MFEDTIYLQITILPFFVKKHLFKMLPFLCHSNLWMKTSLILLDGEVINKEDPDISTKCRFAKGQIWETCSLFSIYLHHILMGLVFCAHSCTVKASSHGRLIPNPHCVICNLYENNGSILPIDFSPHIFCKVLFNYSHNGHLTSWRASKWILGNILLPMKVVYS